MGQHETTTVECLAWAGRAPLRRFARLVAGFRDDVARAVATSKPSPLGGPTSCAAIHQSAISRLREWGYAST